MFSLKHFIIIAWVVITTCIPEMGNLGYNLNHSHVTRLYWTETWLGLDDLLFVTCSKFAQVVTSFTFAKAYIVSMPAQVQMWNLVHLWQYHEWLADTKHSAIWSSKNKIHTSANSCNSVQTRGLLLRDTLQQVVGPSPLGLELGSPWVGTPLGKSQRTHHRISKLGQGRLEYFIPKCRLIVPHVQVYFLVSLCWAIWSQRLTKWGHHHIFQRDFGHFPISLPARSYSTVTYSFWLISSLESFRLTLASVKLQTMLTSVCEIVARVKWTVCEWCEN